MNTPSRSVLYDMVRDAHHESVSLSLAIAQVLVDKGAFTNDDYELVLKTQAAIVVAMRHAENGTQPGRNGLVLPAQNGDDQ